MTLSKTFVGTTIFAMSCMLGAAISGQDASRNSLSKSTCQSQVLSFSMDEDPLCVLARQLAEWICGNSMKLGIDQLTDGFVDQVDWANWDSLEPLITRSMDKIDVILDPNQTPSLDPFDAGSGALMLNTSSMTTEDMGDDLCESARKAAEEICNASNPDHEYAGTLFRQTRWLLADLYDRAKP
ncbi:MAG: hypothetical protein IH984_04785 [Planctomycetes bacterium]|nr:hypothetical protein [Planctomycetota bacterium]